MTAIFEPSEEGVSYGTRYGLVLMRPDGSQPTEIGVTRHFWGYEEGAVRHPDEIAACAWAADGDALYNLSVGGTLTRLTPPGGAARRVWQAPAAQKGYQWWFNSLAPSPSGRWIAVTGFMSPLQDSGNALSVAGTWVVAADGTGAVPIAGARADELIWSQDGECLFLLWHPTSSSTELLRWREGDLQTFPLHVPFSDLSRAAAAHMWQVQAVGLPDRGLLLWGPGGVGRVDAQGRFSYAAAAVRALVPEYRFVALDRRGRAIVTSDRRLLAVDVAAGSITTIYP